MSKNERIEELLKLAQSLPAQSCENLICIAKGMQIATELADGQQSA